MSYYRSGQSVEVWAILGSFFTLLTVLVFSAYISYGTDYHTTITVAERFQGMQEGSDIYRVVDEEGNTYNVNDSFWYWKFRSTDLWTGMKEGERYHVRVYGWRIGFLSWFPNIIEAELVE